MLVILLAVLSAMVPLIAYQDSLIFTGQNVTLKSDIALAAYAGQLQILSVFASIPPLLFIVREKTKPEPDEKSIRLVIGYALLLIVLSTIGMASSLLGIMRQEFGFISVGLPFNFVILDAEALVAYVLGTGGFLNRLLSWVGLSWE